MEKLGSVVCPFCKSPDLIVSEYPSKRGWRLTCKGQDGHRVRIYAEGIQDAVASSPDPAPVLEIPRKSKAKELLERAARLAA